MSNHTKNQKALAAEDLIRQAEELVAQANSILGFDFAEVTTR
jgi:hypothetical protein